MIQQRIDNGRISYKKALDDGINGAISSILPPINRNYFVFASVGVAFN